MRRAFVLIVCCACGVQGWAATIVVTNATDEVNGDVRDPVALLASPGADGVSLREAVLAANGAAGPHDIEFAPSLAGQTIPLRGAPLQLARSGTSLTGLLRDDGTPSITIDGSAATWSGSLAGAVIYVQASRMRVARLRLAGATNNFIEVLAGTAGPARPAGWIDPPAEVADVLIEENVFDNGGYPFAPFLTAVRVWMHASTTVTAKIARVAVRRNRVTGYTQSNDAGFIVSASGRDSVIEDVSIEENDFLATFPLEVSYISGIGCTIRRTTIARNRLLNPTVAMLIGTIGTRGRENTGNTIEDTLIAANDVRGRLSSISLTSFTADPEAAIRGCVTRNTTLRNNLIAMGQGLQLVAGKGNVSGNRIENVLIVNNTIVTGPLAAIAASSNLEGASGNTISGLEIRNTLLDGPVRNQTGPENEIEGEVAPSQVFHSLTKMSAFAGNGNVIADAQFADRAAGDFRLPPGSPAIGAADSGAAPLVDADCRTRAGAPDIGAYEFASPFRPRLTILTDGAGSGRAFAVPAGIPCGGTITASHPLQETVRLTATPSRHFAGWSGGDCAAGTVIMDRDRTCVAHFDGAGRRRVARP